MARSEAVRAAVRAVGTAVLLLSQVAGLVTTTRGAEAAGFRVVIDAGHGGKDPGTVSALLAEPEKAVALDVALRLGAALQRRGIDVVYTRTADRDVPLGERAALGGRVGAQALVSLHLNSAPNAAAAGAEGWHGGGERDAELAAALLDGAAPALSRSGVGVRGTRAGPELAVLRGTAPAALIELGYVTNPGDAQALAQTGFRTQVAEGLADGLVRFRDGATQARPPVVLTGMGGAMGSAPLAGMYFVRPGDTLRAIATRLGIPHEALKLMDGEAAEAHTLQVGQPLQIAGAADRGEVRLLPAQPAKLAEAATQLKAAATAAPRSTPPARGGYVVQEGDTLTRIAKAKGVSVRELVQWNALADPDYIRIGQELRVTPRIPG